MLRKKKKNSQVFHYFVTTLSIAAAQYLAAFGSSENGSTFCIHIRTLGELSHDVGAKE